MKNEDRNYICAHCGRVTNGSSDTDKCVCTEEWLKQIDDNYQAKKNNKSKEK